jgi:hypothetical protein
MDVSAVSSIIQFQQNVAAVDGASQQIAAVAGSGGDAVDIAASLVAMLNSQIGTAASVQAIKSEVEAQRQIIDMFV